MSNWTAVPRQIVPEYAQKMRVRFVLVAVAVAAVCGPCALVISGARSATSASATSAAADPQGRYQGFAQLAALDWIAGRPTALPIADGLPPDFGRGSAPPATAGSTTGTPAPAKPTAFDVQSIGWYSVRTGKVGSVPYELHTFLIRSGQTVYRLAVTVLATDNGPVVGAVPTLTPAQLPASGSHAALDYKQLASEAALNDGATAQITAWATAYATGDGQTLYRLTGDTQARTYDGLGGFVLAAQPAVLSSVVGKSADLAQVRLQLRSVTNPALVITGDYDLLLSGVGSQVLPAIVAWGPAGSGPQLSAYENGTAASTTPDQSGQPTTTTAPTTDAGSATP